MSLTSMTVASHAAIDTLAAANRPAQFDLAKHVADHLSASPAVTHLLVRGSLARGTADRLSDVDFVVGIAEEHFEQFIAVTDAFVTGELGAILPGWPDTIVAPMGGLGYVYLVPHDGTLHQLDLYLAPTSRIDHIQRTTGAHMVFARDAGERYPTIGRLGRVSRGDVAAFVADLRDRPLSCTQQLVEVLVVGQMIRKRIARGQQFIAYAETHLLNTAVKNLIKAALAPASPFYGWYQLEAEIGRTPIGRACLRDLAALICAPAIPTADTLADALNRVVAIAERATPTATDALRPAIEAYWHYQELT